MSQKTIPNRLLHEKAFECTRKPDFYRQCTIKPFPFLLLSWKSVVANRAWRNWMWREREREKNKKKSESKDFRWGNIWNNNHDNKTRGEWLLLPAKRMFSQNFNILRYEALLLLFYCCKAKQNFFCFLEGFPSYSQVERKKKPREETFVKSAGDSAECLVWGLP